jgi:hypothetical protein
MKQKSRTRTKTTGTQFNPRESYRSTMQSLRRDLSPGRRAFSRFIHIPFVESLSDTLDQTILRPSVILGATLTALIVGGTLYFNAERYGFPLSGSEFVASLVVGALIGLLVEFVWYITRLLSR